MSWNTLHLSWLLPSTPHSFHRDYKASPFPVWTHLALKLKLKQTLGVIQVWMLLLTFRPRREPASRGIADLLLSVMRPIRWSPSLDGCHVTGCYRRSYEGSDEALSCKEGRENRNVLKRYCFDWFSLMHLRIWVCVCMWVTVSNPGGSSTLMPRMCHVLLKLTCHTVGSREWQSQSPAQRKRKRKRS